MASDRVARRRSDARSRAFTGDLSRSRVADGAGGTVGARAGRPSPTARIRAGFPGLVAVVGLAVAAAGCVVGEAAQPTPVTYTREAPVCQALAAADQAAQDLTAGDAGGPAGGAVVVAWQRARDVAPPELRPALETLIVAAGGPPSPTGSVPPMAPRTVPAQDPARNPEPGAAAAAPETDPSGTLPPSAATDDAAARQVAAAADVDAFARDVCGVGLTGARTSLPATGAWSDIERQVRASHPDAAWLAKGYTALVGRGRQLSVAVSGPTDRAEAKTICEDIRSGVAAAGEPARVVVWVRDPSGTPLATTTSDGRCVT